MRQLIGNFHVSLDGVVQSPGGQHEDPRGGFDLGGWCMSYGDEVSGQSIFDSINEDYDLLLGRRTYEIWAAHWPFQNADENSLAAKFNEVTKYVPTNSLSDADWENTSLLTGDAANTVAELKATPGDNLHIWGSADLMQTLNAAGLVDEYRLWIYPIVLGKGLKLFETGTPPMALTCASSVTSPTGITISVLRPSGLVQPTPHDDETPNAVEQARRDKIAHE